MSAPKTILPPEVVLEVYQRHQGNKTEAAKELGLHRGTLRNLVNLYGFDKRPLLGGTSKPIKNNVMPLPPKGKVKRYILSSAQNNTRVFAPFLRNLEAYAEWLRADGGSESVQIMLSRFFYNKNAFNNLSKSKPGQQIPTDSDVWFDPSIEPYVCDDPERHGTCRYVLAPDLQWCSEFQIEPTAVRPTSGLGTYTGTSSCIFPHTKLAIESVPTVPGTPTKMVFTTGSVTTRNYIQRKAGLKAEFHHVQSACLVEVTDDGSWWCRHLISDHKGEFFDIPEGNVVKVTSKEGVTVGHRTEAINWGDTHVTEMPKSRVQRYWVGTKVEPAVIDRLQPRYQFHNDLFSHRARSHHEMKSLEKMLQKYIVGDDKVDAEIKNTAEFLSIADRANCLAVVVCSNHDRHLERYLDEVDYRHDLPNIEWFLNAQLARVRAIKAGESWMCLPWALQQAGCPETVRFLRIDESFIICRNHPIECSLHGDIGPNGSRGSTANLANVGSRVNKGHSHTLEVRNGVWSAGTCAQDQSYNKGGVTTWSVSHILTYMNGRRVALVERAGKLWA